MLPSLASTSGVSSVFGHEWARLQHDTRRQHAALCVHRLHEDNGQALLRAHQQAERSSSLLVLLGLGLNSRTMAWSAVVSTLRCTHRHAAGAAHTALRSPESLTVLSSPPCVSIGMQTVLVRCPHSGTWLAGSGVGAADVVDGAEKLRMAEEMRARTHGTLQR